MLLLLVFKMVNIDKYFGPLEKFHGLQLHFFSVWNKPLAKTIFVTALSMNPSLYHWFIKEKIYFI